MDLRRSASDLDRDLSRIAWTDWTPTITAEGGGPPTVTINTAAYLKLGKLVYIQVDISITAANGSTGVMFVTLPHTPNDSSAFFNIGHGRESSVVNELVTASWFSGAAKMGLERYGNTTVIVAGYRVAVSGVYRVA